MNNFCTEMSNAILNNLGRYGVKSEDISCIGEKCAVSIGDKEIQFYFNPRDNSVSSKIVSRSDELVDPIYPHIVHKIYSDITWIDRKSNSRSMHDEIECEVRNLKFLLENIDLHRTSIRDLHFFQDGYNRAYNDYCQ